MMRHIMRAWALLLTLATLPSVASAEEAQSYEVDWTTDGVVMATALVGTALMMLSPVDTENRWESETFGLLDERVKMNFSRNAAHLSDGLVSATILAPLLLELNNNFDADAGRRTLLYGESLAVSLVFNSVAKYTVQRPRPYVYNASPSVQAYAKKQGKDGHASFYSGHASLSFTAAVAGSTIFASTSDNERAKAALWAVELGMASATSLFRIRAGKHFHSDVLVGVVAGSLVGMVVPALHSDQGLYQPSGLEWAAMAAGVGIGALSGLYLPLSDQSPAHALRLAPQATSDGGGLSITGHF